MRGKRHHRAFRNLDLRNIPAYAGKTTAFALVGMFTTEHPRVCGENGSLPISAF